jgi:hypothetical protein
LPRYFTLAPESEDTPACVSMIVDNRRANASK